MRKRSFTIIEIQEMITNYEEYNRYISTLNLQISLLKELIYLYYYLIVNFFNILNIRLYSKKYAINECFIDKFDKRNNCILTIYDNGISISNSINNFFINYEYIIKVITNEDCTGCIFVTLPIVKNLFLKNTNTLMNNKDPLYIFLEIDYSYNLFNLTKHIKNNMIYHIKYNKIDLSIFQNRNFYKSKYD
jgi:hypothetical protein